MTANTETERDLYPVQEFRVYVLSDPGKGLSKIGMSINPERRAKHILRVGVAKLHWQSEVLDDARLVEILAHRRMADCHHAGEWFTATPDECIAAVKEAMAVARTDERPDWARAAWPAGGTKANRENNANKVQIKIAVQPVVVEMLDAEMRIHDKYIYSGRPSLINTLIVEALKARARKRSRDKKSGKPNPTRWYERSPDDKTSEGTSQ